MISRKSAAALAATMVAAGAMAVAAPVSATEATEATVPFLCRTMENGGWVPINGHKRIYDAAAPATVRPNQTFKIVIDPAPTTTNATYLKAMKDITTVFQLAGGAYPVSVQLTGGSNIGTAPSKATYSGGKLTVTTPGPIIGGQTYDLPTVTLNVVAPARGKVTSIPGGTSFSDLGFHFQRQVVGDDAWGPGQCYPDPAQPVTYTSTAVTPGWSATEVR
jgi:dehydratase